MADNPSLIIGGIILVIGVLLFSGAVKIPGTSAIFTSSGVLDGGGCSTVVVGISGKPQEFTSFSVPFRVHGGINHQGASFTFDGQPITVTHSGGGGTFDAGTQGVTEDLSGIINSKRTVNSDGEMNELSMSLCAAFNAPTPQTQIEFFQPSFNLIEATPELWCSDGIFQGANNVGAEQLEEQVDCGRTCIINEAIETCNNIDDNRNCLIDEGGVCEQPDISDIQPSPGFNITNVTTVNIDGKDVTVIREQQIITQVERTIVYDSPSTNFEETKNLVGRELFAGRFPVGVMFAILGIFIIIIIFSLRRR